MGAKVRWIRGSWYVVVHADGRRTMTAVGAVREEADQLARTINRQLAAKRRGGLGLDPSGPILVEDALHQWLDAYAPTLSLSYRLTARSLIARQLVPLLGQEDLRSLTDAHVARLAGDILKEGRSAKTVANAIGILRRVVRIAVDEGLLARNPIPGAGRIVSQVSRQQEGGVRAVDSWTPEEVSALLTLARKREAALYPVLLCAFSTGMRKGELIALRWADIDLARGKVWVRRSRVRGHERAPKSGKARSVDLPHALAEDLRERARLRRLERPWDDEEHVYLSPESHPWEERNLHRSWARLRRRAAAEGIRPLSLHCTRHTVATLHLEAGMSVRWVADQLGHADPTLTLRTYGHVLRDVERDLGHLDWSGDAPRRRQDGDRRRSSKSKE